MSYTPQFRTAVRTDVPLILQMIRDLADYENLLDEVIADEATLEDWLFDRQRAEAMDEWTVYRLSGDTLQRLAE